MCCNLVGFGQVKTLTRYRWMGERRGDGNKPSHFLPAVVLPVAAFCYLLLGHPTSTALALSGGRKTIPFSCLFKPKSATSISPQLLISCCSVILPSVLQLCPNLCKKFINQSPCKTIWVYHLLPFGTLTGTRLSIAIIVHLTLRIPTGGLRC